MHLYPYRVSFRKGALTMEEQSQATVRVVILGHALGEQSCRG